MINPRTYGFSKTDAEELVELIGNGDVEYPEGSPRRGGGGGVLDLRNNNKDLQYTKSASPSTSDWITFATFDMRLSGTSLQFTLDGGDTWHTWHTVGTECPDLTPPPPE